MKYDKLSQDFENYMNSKNTWFSKKYPEEKNDLIAYFSAELRTRPNYSDLFWWAWNIIRRPPKNLQVI